jgi:nucleoid-associated protein YgaU
MSQPPDSDQDQDPVPSFAQAPAQPPEPAMDHDPDSPDRDEPAPAGPAEVAPRPKRPGLVAMVLTLASKLPLPSLSLGTERHEMMPRASHEPSPPAGGHARASATAGPRRAPARFPFLALSRETRVGIAALLSFVVLVAALVVEKGGIGKQPIPLAVKGPAEGDSAPIDPDKKGDGKKDEPKGDGKKDEPKGDGKKDPGKKEKGNDGPSAPAPAPTPGPGEGTRPLETPPTAPEPKPRLGRDPADDEPVALPPTHNEGSSPAVLGKAAPTDMPPMIPEGPAATLKPPDGPLPANDPLTFLDTTTAPAPLPAPAPASPIETPAPAVDKAKDADASPAPPSAPASSSGHPLVVDPIQAPPPVTASNPPPIPTPTPSPPQPPVISAAPIPAENPPTLETVPAVEPSATKVSTAGALGSRWLVIPSGGRRIVGAVPIVSTPAEAHVDSPRVADGPRFADDPATADQVEPVVHTVQPGENFWTISKLYYHSGRFYKALHAANRRQVPDIRGLYVGTVLRIPPPEALDRSLIDPPGRPGDDPAASIVSRTSKRAEPADEADLGLPARPRPVRPDPEAVEPPRRPTYKVKANETLRGIARDTLGDPRRYREIYNLNRDSLDDINVPPATGTTLTLPEDATVGRRSR